MNAENKVTVIIILHNRHQNIERLLEYYGDHPVDLILADSSDTKHIFRGRSCRHIYVPGKTYTQKIEYTLQHVNTPYVALCADDDFTVITGLISCIAFLENNPDYVSCQGQILRYYKDTIAEKIRYGMLYKGDHTLDLENCNKRIQKLFDPYKSLLYALHRTNNLKYVFEGAGMYISNLYLNEYLASVLPLSGGKHKDIRALFQLREYYELSDDKTAVNIDTLISSNEPGYRNFLDYISMKLAETGSYCDIIEINKILNDYALKIRQYKIKKTSLSKKISGMAMRSSFITGIIKERRRLKDLSDILRNIRREDMIAINEIERILKKYSVAQKRFND